MSHDLEALSARALSAARKAGADAADVLVSNNSSVSIDVRAGELETAEREEGTDIGLRVMVGKRQACVAASDLRDSALEQMAERAVAMAREAPEDPFVGLADPDQLATEWDLDALDLFDDGPDPTPARLQEDATRAEAAALAIKGVTQVQSASGIFGRSNLHLAASNGFSGGMSGSERAITAIAIAGEGLEMEREFAAESRVYSSDLPTPEEIGARAGERAIAMLGAKKPPTGAYPVVFDERVASGLIGHLLSAVNGSAIARGASWLRDALGQQVLPGELSVIEDPLRVRTAGSRPFDAEGLPTQRRAIVENGVLTGWTLDLATGRKLGMPSTGNAARGPSSPPMPSLSNIALTQGTQSRGELLAEMGTGLLVTSLIGSSINANTGDYSRGASGFWVENGEITYPVNECTLAGNLRDMLMTITPANDARTHLSRVVPSLRVEGLTLAGK